MLYCTVQYKYGIRAVPSSVRTQSIQPRSVEAKAGAALKTILTNSGGGGEREEGFLCTKVGDIQGRMIPPPSLPPSVASFLPSFRRLSLDSLLLLLLLLLLLSRSTTTYRMMI